MPKKSFSGRISFVVLIVTGVIIAWGIISFLTPHETLTQGSADNSFFSTTSLDSNPDVKNAVVKTLVLSTQENPGNMNDPLEFVNGDANPVVSIRPGEIQRWKMVNSTESDFFNVSIPGLTFFIVARDGNVTTIPLAASEELLAPRDTIEILVQGPGWGSYEVVSKPLEGSGVGEEFMILKSESFPVFNASLPVSLVPNYDLRNAKISNYKNFKVNSKSGEMLTDTPVVKTVEEWTVTNNSSEFVPFTTQGGIFQVVEINGTPIERHGYDKTFTVPPSGFIKIRVQNT